MPISNSFKFLHCRLFVTRKPDRPWHSSKRVIAHSVLIFVFFEMITNNSIQTSQVMSNGFEYHHLSTSLDIYCLHCKLLHDKANSGVSRRYPASRMEIWLLLTALNRCQHKFAYMPHRINKIRNRHGVVTHIYVMQ